MRCFARPLALSAVLLVGGVLLAPAASADDCEAQVQGIGDLADEAKVQDCLRTGGNWGRTVGTVIGVTAVAVAATGLRRPSGSGDPCQNEQDALQRADARQKELDALNRDVRQEFLELQRRAQTLTWAYRQLHVAANKIDTAVRLARFAHGTYILSLIFLIGGAIQMAGAAGGGAAAGGAAGGTAAGGAGAGGAATGLGGAAQVAGRGVQAIGRGAVRVLGTKAGAGAGAVVGTGEVQGAVADYRPLSPGSPPSFSAWTWRTDFWGEGIERAMYGEWVKVWWQYRAAAEELNEDFKRWAERRVEDINRAQQAVADEVADANHWARLCLIGSWETGWVGTKVSAWLGNRFGRLHAWGRGTAHPPPLVTPTIFVPQLPTTPNIPGTFGQLVRKVPLSGYVLGPEGF